MSDKKIIEAMAIAICNEIRKQHKLAPIRTMAGVANPENYLNQAKAALGAYRKIALGH